MCWLQSLQKSLYEDPPLNFCLRDIQYSIIRLNPICLSLTNGVEAWFWIELFCWGRHGIGSAGRASISSPHELVKNLREGSWNHLWSLLLYIPKRKKACPLWMPFGNCNLLLHPGPALVHQHTCSVSYSGYNYLLYNQLKLCIAWKLSSAQISHHNQCDLNTYLAGFFKTNYPLDHFSPGFFNERDRKHPRTNT